MLVTLSKKSTLSARLSFVAKESSKKIPDFAGDSGETTVRYNGKTVSIYCGLGEKAACTTATIRTAAARGINRALELKRGGISLETPDWGQFGKNGAIAAIEGALLGSYRFAKYKSEKPCTLKKLEIAGGRLGAAEVRRTETVCAAVAYARDLVNENASVMTPQRLAAEARAVAAAGRMRCTVLDEKDIARRGLGLLGAVGRASPHPPRLVLLHYNGNRSSGETTAIVGKGITFDSGGQNLKPTGSIETMRLDMAGAAAVLAAMKAVAELRPRVNVVGCIAAAHNAIGRDAYFPGDIYRSLSGKTVEVCSTDAEGRLVLADAITFCLQTCRPSRIVDIATLTGGILVALGEQAAGLFSNNDALAQALFASGERTGERLWRLPLYQEFRDAMKSDLADLRNISKFKKGYAGPSTGAAFIQEFAGDTPWAHLDIAGAAWNEGSGRGEVPQYATGFGVRLLLDFLAAE
jgi:leucyl aminopeptidase